MKCLADLHDGNKLSVALTVFDLRIVTLGNANPLRDLNLCQFHFGALVSKQLTQLFEASGFIHLYHVPVSSSLSHLLDIEIFIILPVAKRIFFYYIDIAVRNNRGYKNENSLP
jgi:hypothetical protein